jgi:predicted acetyltransferase
MGTSGASGAPRGGQAAPAGARGPAPGRRAPVVRPRLMPPDVRWHRSVLEALDECHAAGEHGELPLEALADPAEFARYVAALLDDVARPGALARYVAALPGGSPPEPPDDEPVPQTVLWWVEGDEFLGRVSIRHRLTRELLYEGGNIGYEVRPGARRQGHATAMLAAALPLAAALGIEEALVDCSVDNDASRRVIEKNGGRLLGEGEGELYYLLPTRPR